MCRSGLVRHFLVGEFGEKRFQVPQIRLPLYKAGKPRHQIGHDLPRGLERCPRVIWPLYGLEELSQFGIADRHVSPPFDISGITAGEALEDIMACLEYLTRGVELS